ncbi:metallophosphoesterase family protein [Pandoraea sputorum]|uniref:Uncharacterized protein n=1 Tax=Pandoraea sputorum TaxID=93222 RepID=A0A5E5BKQ0_9BURK|nr:DUF4049 domain-containing protein [Pandoraea sputorum]VVE85938.1 hypothetical protein PSP31121_05571 [Pandoraea sputorum]
MPTVSPIQFSRQPSPTVAAAGETLHGRKTGVPLDVTSPALHALQQTAVPAFRAQLCKALASGHDLGSLGDCERTLQTLQQDLNNVRPVDATDATFRLGTTPASEGVAAPWARVFTSLANTAASLDQVREELKEKMRGERPPSWAMRLLHQVGTFLGIVVAAGLLVGVWLWGLPVATGIALAGAGATLAVIAGIVAERIATAQLHQHAAFAERLGARLAQLDTLRAMVIRADRDMMVANLRDQLTPEAANYHAQLLALEEVDVHGNSVSHAPMGFGPQTVCFGDGDGSDARLLLAALQAGYLSITAEGQAILAHLLQAEADFVRHLDKRRPDFQEFQEHTELQALVAELYHHHLTFREGVDLLISVGDVCHDRFSNNKNISRLIREALKARGVTFLEGNHDDHLLTRDRPGEPSPKALFGAFAKDTATPEQWLAHQQTVFERIYYDQASGVAVNHQGFGIGPDGTVQAANGFFVFKDNPAEFFLDVQNNNRVAMPQDAATLTPCQKLQLLMSLSDRDRPSVDLPGVANCLPLLLLTLPRSARTLDRWTPEQEQEIATWLENAAASHGLNDAFWQRRLTFHLNGADQLKFQTSFRPRVTDCQALVKAFADRGHRVTLVKGHDGQRTTGGGVLSINARNSGGYCPTALILRTPAAVNMFDGNPWLALPRIDPAKMGAPLPRSDANSALETAYSGEAEQ